MKALATASIGEAADRSGFPAATLRYYDELGLVRPSVRTPAGYRRYSERDLERLGFVARAKQLGCSLEEIASLLGAYDGGICGPMQDQLRQLVATKIGDAQQRLLEVTRLLADLQRAAAGLEQHRPDGPCDDRCGCLSEPDATPASSTPQRVEGLQISRTRVQRAGVAS